MSAPLLVTVGECLGLVSGVGAGGLAYGTQAEISFGGAEGNVAICASRQGARVAWVGRIGEDPFGDRIVRTLRGEGVEVHAVRDPSRFTAMMLKERTGAGATRVSYLRHGAAGSGITPADLPGALLAAASVLHVTGISAGLSDSSHETVRAAVAAARSADAAVSFDVNHRSKLWDAADAAASYRALAAAADIVFAGEDEAEILVGRGTVPELAARLAALGPREVIVKRGERGAYALVDGAVHVEPAVPVRAVDTVGAGDAFVGAYLTARMRGASLAERMAAASASGAAACLRTGDWEAMPNRDQLRQLRGGGDPVER
ncbi:sugar kinase [Leucobacter sp. PH1c]|uniref:sugar kinase n=1 Tax=Leucobacter sp. PH1c TaxID=1397278 RepID=UPI0004685261|nr:sugar kinase [Leucobacter sp. PH1c]